jgi:hypothetical protein
VYDRAASGHGSKDFVDRIPRLRKTHIVEIGNWFSVCNWIPVCRQVQMGGYSRFYWSGGILSKFAW